MSKIEIWRSMNQWWICTIDSWSSMIRKELWSSIIDFRISAINWWSSIKYLWRKHIAYVNDRAALHADLSLSLSLSLALAFINDTYMLTPLCPCPCPSLPLFSFLSLSLSLSLSLYTHFKPDIYVRHIRRNVFLFDFKMWSETSRNTPYILVPDFPTRLYG